MKSIVLAVRQPEFYEDSARPKRYSRIGASAAYFVKRYGMVSFFIMLLLTGMVIGASQAGATHGESADRLIGMLIGGTISANDSTALGVFADSFAVSFLFAAALVCMSLSPFGVVTVPSIMLMRGVCFGAISGYMCITYGLKGLAYYICVMLTGAFVSSLALVYIAQYCMDFSFSVFRAICGKVDSDSRTLKNKLCNMILNAAYMLILIGFASLADTVLNFLLGGLFSF